MRTGGASVLISLVTSVLLAAATQSLPRQAKQKQRTLQGSDGNVDQPGKAAGCHGHGRWPSPGIYLAGRPLGIDNGPGNRAGIQALEDIDEVAIAIVPAIWHEDLRNALINHCTTMADRFAIIDPPPGLTVQERIGGPINEYRLVA